MLLAAILCLAIKYSFPILHLSTIHLVNLLYIDITIQNILFKWYFSKERFPIQVNWFPKSLLCYIIQTQDTIYHYLGHLYNIICHITHIGCFKFCF